MVVVEDVTDSAGRVLVAAGIPVSERHLKQLKTWGIREVEIQEEQQTLGAAALDGAQEEGVRNRFSHLDLDHPLLAHLLARALEKERTTETSS